jgi:hypothetical protein
MILGPVGSRFSHTWKTGNCKKQHYIITTVEHAIWLVMPQNKVHRRPTSWFFLWFSYDFGVTRNSSSKADAMVLASGRLRGIHPPDIIQNGGHPGGNASQTATALSMASAFWWWIMAWQRLLESTFCVPYSVDMPSGSGYPARGIKCLRGIFAGFSKCHCFTVVIL